MELYLKPILIKIRPLNSNNLLLEFHNLEIVDLLCIIKQYESDNN